ncbi:MAG: STAS domain-containing protein [Anaerolineae bacterium]|nr:STAS domain-containing protein [Anaerolineae bacterium]
MNIVISQEQGRVPVTVFHLEGEIGADNYEQIQTQAQQAFAGGMRNLLLDLSEVTFISSAGFRALHYIFTLLRTDAPDENAEAMHKGLRDGTFKSPHLKLFNPQANALKALKTAGFDMFLEIYYHRQKAIDSFS